MSDIKKVDENNSGEKQEAPSIKTSIFFGKYAIWIWTGFLLAGVWFSFTPLIAVSIFLLLLSVLTFFWKERSLKNLTPELRVNKSRIFAGEQFHAEASLKNNKWLPLIWVEWEFPNKNEVIWGEAKQEKYIIRFLWLLWFQKISWSVKGEAAKRGVYHIGNITLRSGDGFRFSEKEISCSLHHQLYIYPKLYPVTVPEFNPSIRWQVKGRQGGFLEDPLIINGIREYQPGDEWRKFNWKASARTGKMLTNIYQPVVTKQVLIFIDVKGFYVQLNEEGDKLRELIKLARKKQEEFEYLLSIAASVGEAYHQKGIQVGCYGNAINYLGNKQQYISPAAEITPFLDSLAELTYRVGTGQKQVLDHMLYAGMMADPFMIFCETITKEHYQWYELHKHEVPLLGIYYLSESEYSQKLAGTAKNTNALLASS